MGREEVIISKKDLKLALAYAALEPESGYPDMNAAIMLAKTLLRVCKQQRQTGAKK